jgi:hypothetical protein
MKRSTAAMIAAASSRDGAGTIVRAPFSLLTIATV